MRQLRAAGEVSYSSVCASCLLAGQVFLTLELLASRAERRRVTGAIVAAVQTLMMGFDGRSDCGFDW